MQERAQAAVLHLGALASLARAHVLGDVDVLAHPDSEDEACFPSWPFRSAPAQAVVARAENLCAQSVSEIFQIIGT